MFLCNLSDSQTSVSTNYFSHTCHGLLSVGGGWPEWVGVVFKDQHPLLKQEYHSNIFDRLRQDSPKAARSISYFSTSFPQLKTEIDTHTLLHFPLQWDTMHTAGRRSVKGFHRANAERYRPMVLHIYLHRVDTCPTPLPLRYVLQYPGKKTSPRINWSVHVYLETGGSTRWHFYLHLGRSTLIRLRHIPPSVYCPSYRKQCNNWWPGISGVSHWSISPTSTTICLQTREVHTNCSAPCDYTYKGSSGKQKVTLELYYILRELLIAIHMT